MKVVIAVLAPVLAFGLFAAPAQAATHSNTLSCTAASTGGAPTSFNFKMSLTAGGPYATIGSSPTCSFVDSQNMVEGQKRFYVFTAVNSAGESAQSTEVSGTTPFSVPDAPTAPKVMSQ